MESYSPELFAHSTSLSAILSLPNVSKDMKKSTFLIFIAYIWTKTLLGLTFSPFTTIRQVTRRPVLLPVILSPFIGLFAFFIFGRIGSFLINVYGLKREAIALLLSTVLISIVLWQALLIYLLISLIVTRRRN